MTYTIVYEKIKESNFPPGYFYAHIPSLDLTTHGLGIEGAERAAKDLLKLWLEEKKSNGEVVSEEAETFYSRINIEDAIHG
ncbi:MAG: type II toxin-antitoxin system HicB family antitoxin [Melioribacteraceae bacterium]